MYKNYDDLPLMLSVHDVAEVLGISKSSAYVLAKEKGFPTLKIGARVVVPRDRFIEWINKQAVALCHSQSKEIISCCRMKSSIWI